MYPPSSVYMSLRFFISTIYYHNGNRQQLLLTKWQTLYSSQCYSWGMMLDWCGHTLYLFHVYFFLHCLNVVFKCSYHILNITNIWVLWKIFTIIIRFYKKINDKHLWNTMSCYTVVVSYIHTNYAQWQHNSKTYWKVLNLLCYLLIIRIGMGYSSQGTFQAKWYERMIKKKTCEAYIFELLTDGPSDTSILNLDSSTFFSSLVARNRLSSWT